MQKRTIILSGVMALTLATGASLLSAEPQRGLGWGMMGPGGGPWMMGPGRGYMGRGAMGMGCPMFDDEDDGQTDAFVDGRIAFIKAELGITEAQQSDWDAYAKAVKTNFESMRGMRQQMQSLWEANSPVERLDAQISAMEIRLTSLKEMKPAVARLYETLTEKQREAADAVLTTMGCMM